MEALQSRPDWCPYCGEPIELLMDCPEPGQRYTEDCHVCCRPIDVEWLAGAGGRLEARVRRDDEV